VIGAQKKCKFYQNHDHPNEIVLVCGKILGSTYPSRPARQEVAVIIMEPVRGYYMLRFYVMSMQMATTQKKATNFPSQTNCDVRRTICEAINFSVGKYVMSSHVSKLFSQIKFARALC